jgi:hypothetical protein
MTIFAIALAIAACIGWTAHTRVLRHVLHKAWAEIDALEAERDEAATEDPAPRDPHCSRTSGGCEIHPRGCP